MKEVIFLFLIIAFLVPAKGFSKNIKGKLIQLKSGEVLDFAIQKVFAKSSGKVLAKNNSSGEIFEGTYTALRVTTHSSEFGNFFGSNGKSAFYSGNNFSSSNIVPAQATLLGNQKTVIQCGFNIKAGLSPHGMGSCKDNNEQEYSLEF